MSASWFASLRRKKEVPGPAPDAERLKDLRRFAKTHRIPLGDGRRLNEALTHKSYSHERAVHPSYPHNEKLEFLGDSILGLVVCDYLYAYFPGLDEGGLSKIKSVVVSANSLSEKAKKIQLGDALRLGRGEEKSGGRERPALLADALEAVIGAVYLNGGLPAARTFVLGLLEEDLAGARSGHLALDYKTILQEHFQRVEKRAPQYKIVRQWGPDHNRSFEVECHLAGKVLAQGTGKSKKEAEQDAARLTALGIGLIQAEPGPADNIPNET
jgi:ribonuclease III